MKTCYFSPFIVLGRSSPFILFFFEKDMLMPCTVKAENDTCHDHSSLFTFFFKEILIASTVKDRCMWNYSSSLGGLERYVVVILSYETLLD